MKERTPNRIVLFSGVSIGVAGIAEENREEIRAGFGGKDESEGGFGGGEAGEDGAVCRDAHQGRVASVIVTITPRCFADRFRWLGESSLSYRRLWQSQPID
jgi:hypothetical protein